MSEETTLGELSILLGLNTVALTEGAAKAREELAGIEESAGGVGLGIAALGVGAAAYAMKATESFITLGETVEGVMRTTGASAQDASKLVFLANTLNVPVDALSKGLVTLATNVDKNSTAYQALGINLTDSNGHMLGTVDTLEALNKKFAAMPDSLQKTAEIKAALGKNGAALMPILDLPTGQMQAYMDMAQKFGLVLSDSDAAAAKQAAIAHQELSASFKGLSVEVGREVLPVMDELVNGLKGVTTFLDQHQEVASATVKFAALGAATLALSKVWSLLKGSDLAAALIPSIRATEDAVSADEALIAAYRAEAEAATMAAEAEQIRAAAVAEGAGAATAAVAATEADGAATLGLTSRIGGLAASLKGAATMFAGLLLVNGAISAANVGNDKTLKAGMGADSGITGWVADVGAGIENFGHGMFGGAADNLTGYTKDMNAGQNIEYRQDLADNAAALQTYNDDLAKGMTPALAYADAQQQMTQATSDTTDAITAQTQALDAQAQTIAAGSDIFSKGVDYTQTVHHDATSKTVASQVPVYDDAGVQTGVSTVNKTQTVKAYDTKKSAALTPEQLAANASQMVAQTQNENVDLSKIEKELGPKNVQQGFLQQLISVDQANPGTLDAIAQSNALAQLQAMNKAWKQMQAAQVAQAVDVQKAIDDATTQAAIAAAITRGVAAQTAEDKARQATAATDAPKVVAASTPLPSWLKAIVGGQVTKPTTAVAPTRPGQDGLAQLIAGPLASSTTTPTSGGAGTNLSFTNNYYGPSPSAADLATHMAAQAQARKLSQ